MNISAYVIPGITDRELRITPELIMTTVARYYELDPDQIKKVNRRADLVKARRMAMYIMRQYVPMSFAKVGAYFRQDHATVIHGLRVLQDMMEMYPTWRKQFEDLCALLGLRGSTELLLLLQDDYKIRYVSERQSSVAYKGTIVMSGGHKACREFVLRKLNIN